MPTRQGRSGFRKSTRWQTIAHHHELTFRQTRLRQSIRRRARIAHHPVAQSEHSKLRVKLLRGQQIPELAVAANDHRNPGQFSRRDQHQIRVKIEPMRHPDMRFLQMSH
jgi:hypothetical protein